jgi:hypothetical protein
LTRTDERCIYKNRYLLFLFAEMKVRIKKKADAFNFFLPTVDEKCEI